MEPRPQPATAVRVGSEGSSWRIKNVTTSMTRPLYTSCSEHYYAQERLWHARHSASSTTSQSDDIDERSRPRFLTLNTLPRLPSTSPMEGLAPMAFPFMRLPTEIRLQIYALLVLPRRADDLLPSFQKITASTQDYFDYDKKRYGTDRPISADLSNPLLILRTIDPTSYKNRYPGGHRRSTYSVRADRLHTRCMQTTYHCVNNPRIEDNLSILRVSKRVHAEAAELMYSYYTIDFDTHVEAIIPFLSDLTPFARSCIKSIRVVKRALPYVKEFDKFEWHSAMRYLTAPSNNIRLRKLELGIVAGRHGEDGWDRIPRYSASDFELLSTMEDMAWMQYLLEIEGLQELDVQAVVEHCPPGTSSAAMAKFIRFSASVDTAFAEFLKGRLLTSEASPA